MNSDLRDCLCRHSFLLSFKMVSGDTTELKFLSVNKLVLTLYRQYVRFQIINYTVCFISAHFPQQQFSVN